MQHFNSSYRRSGALWESRYKSSPIQAEGYLLLCQRYAELNPVRAALVDDPAHCRWTSNRHNALGQANALLTPHALYRRLGRNAAQRQTAYRALFGSQMERAAIDDIRLALNQNQPLGNARFLDEIERITGQRREARPRGRPRMQLSDAAAPLGQGALR